METIRNHEAPIALYKIHSMFPGDWHCSRVGSVARPNFAGPLEDRAPSFFLPIRWQGIGTGDADVAGFTRGDGGGNHPPLVCRSEDQTPSNGLGPPLPPF